jgi:DNA repair exonuclease SbcCD nuclease subunit
VKLVHAADLHLDSPLRGLAIYDGAPVERVREATRRALINLVELCLRERAALLVLAGDIFDGDWKDFSTGLFFAKQLGRLRDAGVRVLIVRGNHDALSEVTRQLQLPDHVHQFSDERAETITLDDHGVAVHGVSFSHRTQRDSLVPLYPAAVPGLVNIGVLHTSADGRPGHHPYAPCTVEELVRKGYDYWALGHVHAHEVLHREPWIVFAGNTQGRHIRETGPKGCVVVEIDGGRVRSVRHHALDVLRWQRVEITLGEDDGLGALLERARAAFAAARAEADGRLVAVRVAVGGACRLHEDVLADRAAIVGELRALSLDGEDLWLEEIELHTRPPLRLHELRQSEGFVGRLLRAVDEARREPALLEELGRSLAALREKAGDELARAGLDLADPAQLIALLDDAEALLAARLTK